LTDFGLSTGFHKEHDAGYYKKLLAGGAHKSNRDNRQSMNLDQIQLTVSNRTQINTWRKSRRQLAYSTVGTPDYIAPEIFSGQGYDFGCDWWSVGTIMFECLIGWPPFCAEEPHDTYRKIVDWPRNLHFPPDQQLGAEAEDFVRRYVFSLFSLSYPSELTITDSSATPNTASAASAAPTKSSNTPSSAAYHGTGCVVSARRSNPSCSRTSIRSTSPSTRLTRMIPPRRIGRRQRLLRARTSMRLVCRLSGTRTSDLMLSGGHRQRCPGRHTAVWGNGGSGIAALLRIWVIEFPSIFTR
jgi:serine/threonine protein kinase